MPIERGRKTYALYQGIIHLKIKEQKTLPLWVEILRSSSLMSRQKKKITAFIFVYNLCKMFFFESNRRVLGKLATLIVLAMNEENEIENDFWQGKKKKCGLKYS